MQTSKTILIILLVGFQHLCLAQITYQPVFIHQVTNEVDTFESLYVRLKKDTNNYYTNNHIGRDSLLSISLPDTGIYHLMIFSDNYGKIHITESGVIDTFYLRLIYEFHDYEFGSRTHTYWFSYNRKPCNGRVIDYYNNGNIRLEGTFKDGLPIGDLKHYYKNAQLKEHYIYKKNVRIKYFESGIVKEYSNYKKRVYEEY